MNQYFLHEVTDQLSGSISENFSLVREAYKEISAALKINMENYVRWAVGSSRAMKKRKRDLMR